MAVKFRGHLELGVLLRGIGTLAFCPAGVWYATAVLAHALRFGEVETMRKHSHDLISAMKNPGWFGFTITAWITAEALFAFGAWITVKRLREKWLGVDDQPIAPTNFSNR